MAPTETLAKQHYDELSKLFLAHDIRIGFLSGSVRGSERKAVLEGLKNREIHIVTGTHALIQPEVVYSSLGLVITDEQHRFGVNQRILLSKKGVNASMSEYPLKQNIDPGKTKDNAPISATTGKNSDVPKAQRLASPEIPNDTQRHASPDVLVMTATPIPRTLAFILYGDLDISIMDEIPPGRQSVVTRLVNDRGRVAAYDLIRDEVKNGRQAYVVAPLIEETEFSAESDMKSAKLLFAELKKRFKDLKVALLHGRMKQSEKDSVMQAFYTHDIDVLVSTVLIEVGINVPNATVMLIENAERFGLAQLHQLRGRVGRGESRSYCFLVSNSKTKESRERMNVLTSTNDGFVVAEKDLEIRGPGEFFGTRQHGIPPLRVANLVKHIKVLMAVKDEATVLMADDPELVKIKNRGLREKIEQFFQSASDIGL
ncbi:hypothetical protein FACS1894127_6970 [Clostridia bacterium]|nr:hypothetical protein FACS1894127_6970 [Clostridia bacterium]